MKWGDSDILNKMGKEKQVTCTTVGHQKENAKIGGLV
jgi:hypothetical protein